MNRQNLISGLILSIAIIIFLFGCWPTDTVVIPTSTVHHTALPPTHTNTPLQTVTSQPTDSGTDTHAPTTTVAPQDTPTLPTPISTPAEAISEDHIRRGPYIQSITTNSAVIVWETDQPTPSSVIYGATPACSSRVDDPAQTTEHAIKITGLTPYTTYYYNVTGSCQAPDRSRTFKTAAGPDQTQFTFVVFGDTQSQPDIHRTVVEQINEMEPDFLIHTGDLVQAGNNTAQWETFFAIERDLLDHVPFFPTMGNHEDGADIYPQRFILPGNEQWYTFDYGNVRFVSLRVDGIAQFKPDTEQYAWIEDTLAANTQPWLVVYFHIPPFSGTEIDYPSRKGQELLVPLFEKYGVDVVFNGHDHNYQRSMVHGITYIISGGGGGPLYDVVLFEDHLITYEVTHNFIHGTVDGNTLSLVALALDGREIDRVTLTNP